MLDYDCHLAIHFLTLIIRQVKSRHIVTILH